MQVEDQRIGPVRIGLELNQRREYVVHAFSSASQARHFSVSRNFCRLLLGLSEMVISIRPSAIKGLMTCCRNLVRSLRPEVAISSSKVASVTHFSRITTWCQLGG